MLFPPLISATAATLAAQPRRTFRLIPRLIVGLLGGVAVVLLIGLIVGSPAGPSPAGAQGNDGGREAIEVPSDHLVIVTTELEPFVIDDDGVPEGFYAEIWDEVAAELDVTYEVRWVASFGEVLPALDRGEADVAVAPLAPTAARELSYDFTAAVVRSGPQMGFHEDDVVSSSILRALANRSVLNILLAAFIGLVVLAHLIWLLERSHPDDPDIGDFHPSYIHGLWDGFWWATVTVTTVGYGDKAPRSVRGRAVALLAMLLSLFLVGSFVSQLSDVLSQRRAQPPFTTIDDLGDTPVGVVAGSSFESFLQSRGVETVGIASQAALFEAMEAGTVKAMVANPFALNSIGPRHGVVPTGAVLYEEFETFGLAQDSPWREPLNQALADLLASGEVEEIIDRWQN